MDAINGGTYAAFYDMLKHYPELEPWLLRVDQLGSYAVAGSLVLAALLLWLLRGRAGAAAIALAAFLLAGATVELSRAVLTVERPTDAARFFDGATSHGFLTRDDEMQRGFPSRSVFLFSVAALLLTFALWGLVGSTAARAVLLGLAALLIVAVFLSQLFLSLHYLTDTLAGLFGGVACALLARALFPAQPASAATP